MDVSGHDIDTVPAGFPKAVPEIVSVVPALSMVTVPPLLLYVYWAAPAPSAVTQMRAQLESSFIKTPCPSLSVNLTQAGQTLGGTPTKHHTLTAHLPQ